MRHNDSCLRDVVAVVVKGCAKRRIVFKEWNVSPLVVSLCSVRRSRFSVSVAIEE